MAPLSGWEVARLIAFQVLVGAALGVGIGLAALWAMRRFSFSTDGFDAIFVFAVAVLAYAAPAALGGNGYLSTYLVGLILGNRPLPRKKGLVHFFDGVTGLMQMLIFFLLGLLSFPSRLPAVLPSAVLIALFLTLVARPASVLVLLTPFRSPLRQQALVSWAGLRGAASIVFAIMAVTSSVSLTNDIFNIVFSVVLLSMAVQGSLLPAMARGLKMIGQEEDVLRTFNDYAGGNLRAVRPPAHNPGAYVAGKAGGRFAPAASSSAGDGAAREGDLYPSWGIPCCRRGTWPSSVRRDLRMRSIWDCTSRRWISGIPGGTGRSGFVPSRRRIDRADPPGERIPSSQRGRGPAPGRCVGTQPRE